LLAAGFRRQPRRSGRTDFDQANPAKTASAGLFVDQPAGGGIAIASELGDARMRGTVIGHQIHRRSLRMSAFSVSR
jgi:hypothetical protein